MDATINCEGKPRRSTCCGAALLDLLEYFWTVILDHGSEFSVPALQPFAVSGQKLDIAGVLLEYFCKGAALVFAEIEYPSFWVDRSTVGAQISLKGKLLDIFFHLFIFILILIDFSAVFVVEVEPYDLVRFECDARKLGWHNYKIIGEFSSGCWIGLEL